MELPFLSFNNIYKLLAEGGEYDPAPGDVDSIAACQTVATTLEQFGAHHFHFDGNTEECMLYSTLQADCRVVGGPKTAPPLADCP